MNEITLLRDYGPDAEPPSAATLQVARDRLNRELTGCSRRRGLLFGRRTARVRVLALGALAAVLAAVALAGLRPGAVVGLRPGAESPDPVGPVALVAFDSPVFPLALDPAPEGLTARGFTGEEKWMAMSYTSTRDDDRVLLLVRSDRPRVQDAKWVDVGGRTGRFEVRPVEGGPPLVTLHWQRSARQWVSLTGEGRFASESALLALAGTVVDRPQEVPLRVGLAPAGWKLLGFKDNTVLTLRDPRSEQRTMTVQLVARPDPDLRRNVMGAIEVRQVTVAGRPAELVHAEEMWFLQAPVPGGRAFTLQVPLDFTPEQVIAVAEQVTVRR